jgi:hypothetical protein
LARRIAVNSFKLMIASFTIGSHVVTFFGIFERNSQALLISAGLHRRADLLELEQIADFIATPFLFCGAALRSQRTDQLTSSFG